MLLYISVMIMVKLKVMFGLMKLKQVDVILSDETFARAAVPSGASTGNFIFFLFLK